MKEPSPTTIKRLFALSNNRCAFPRCISPIITPSGSVIGKICHINARSKGGPRYDAKQTDEEGNSFANLMLLCGTHHDVIDKQPKVYTADLLREMKQTHEQKGRIEIQPEDSIFANILLNDYRQVMVSKNFGNVMVNSPGAIQANTVHLNTVKKSYKVLPPEGTISSDLRMIGYVKHLVKRYHEFAGGDTTRKSNFSYAALYKNIEKNFGVKWDFVPIDRFDELADYLQKRIDRTRQACINKGKGHKSYSSFEEYCEKYKVKA
jgi:hypothetical protein